MEDPLCNSMSCFNEGCARSVVFGILFELHHNIACVNDSTIIKLSLNLFYRVRELELSEKYSELEKKLRIITEKTGNQYYFCV